MIRHFTATAFVVNSKQETLLLWHKRLKRWMPPGGHVDPDELPEATAARECQEETGLEVDIIGDAQPDLFEKNRHEGQIIKKPIAMLLENIPECEERDEPAHQHMDFVFLARPLDESQVAVVKENEATKLRWFSADEIARLDPNTEIFANVQSYILSYLS